jgi:hypothetical protein
MTPGKGQSNRACLPDPREAQAFVFSRAEYDPDNGEARLVYRFDDGPELVERITFPEAPWPAEPERRAAFQRALEVLHGIAGVSYYKAGFCPTLQIEAGLCGSALVEFLAELYRHGLAECAYVNGLQTAGGLRFLSSLPASSTPGPPAALGLSRRVLLAMGGGKDSLVALDLLQNAGMELQPACIGESSLISETARTAGLPLLQIRRQLAPELAEMNRAGAWNGHVPVTAINSAILLCAAILHDYGYVVFANERSADEATLSTESGEAINHQYSKSSAFEIRFRHLVQQCIAPDIEYFSIVRPYSELGVLQRFSRLTSFHGVFSSCNRNFHLEGPRIETRWCLDCPKCRFAALGLALFLSPAELRSILGGDLLDDPEQLEGFRALCELGSHKPFECVGEAGESRAALLELGRRPEWRGQTVVRALQAELGRVGVPPLGALLEPSGRHCIPHELCTRLGLPEPARD